MTRAWWLLANVVVIAACGGERSTPAISAGSSAGSQGSAGSAAPSREHVRVQCEPAVDPPRTAQDLIGWGAGTGTVGQGRNRGGGGGGIGVVARGYPGRRSLAPEPAQITIEKFDVKGDLEPAIVRRYLLRNRAKLTFCYQKELVAKPALGGGKQQVSFTISETGSVTAASVTGIDDMVAGCTKKIVEEILFPKPKSGTVSVTGSWLLVKGGGVIGPLVAPTTGRVIPVTEPTAWTPFAAGALAKDDVGKAATAAARAAVEQLEPQLATCFGATKGTTGRVRAMLSFDTAGKLASRVGGLGDPAIEACLAKALAPVSIPAPAERVEVACDLQRGDGIDQPWRVSREGYEVIEVGATSFSHAGKTHEVKEFGVGFDPYLQLSQRDKTYLFLVAPDATGKSLGAALAAARDGAASIVAVTASGGAPVFVGMGPDGRRIGWNEQGRTLGIGVAGGKLRACIAGTPQPLEASLLEPAKVDEVMRAALDVCNAPPCTRTVEIAVWPELVAKELVAAASGLQRAGRVFTIGGTTCKPPGQQ